MNAPPFPTSEADLEAWSVYADYLLTKGDRRGELIALDLALSDEPDRDAIAAFHAQARASLQLPTKWTIAYTLGYAREVAVQPAQGKKRGPGAPDTGTLAAVRDLLASEAGSKIESLWVAYDPRDVEARHWNRLFAAIPASCRRLTIAPLSELNRDSASELVAMLPPIRELAIESAKAQNVHVMSTDAMRAFLDGRFETVALGSDPPRTVRYADGVRIVVNNARWLEPPIELVSDVGFVSVARRTALAIRRWSPREYQAKYGIVGVRARLAGHLPERYHLGQWTVEPSATGAIAVRGDDWTIMRDGVVGPLITGAHVGDWVFVERDLTATARELLS